MTPKEKETAFNSFFQHLRDDESLQQVLTVHRAEASKIIKERGPAVFIDHTLLKADATEAQVQGNTKTCVFNLYLLIFRTL